MTNQRALFAKIEISGRSAFAGLRGLGSNFVGSPADGRDETGGGGEDFLIRLEAKNPNANGLVTRLHQQL
jgi:hypothetical protein